MNGSRPINGTALKQAIRTFLIAFTVTFVVTGAFSYLVSPKAPEAPPLVCDGEAHMDFKTRRVIVCAEMAPWLVEDPTGTLDQTRPPGGFEPTPLGDLPNLR